MNIEHGKGTTEYGPGVSINLTADEVAIAIDAYLVSHRTYVQGPRTITVNGKLIDEGHIYVDPSGSVISHGIEISGRGPETNPVTFPDIYSDIYDLDRGDKQAKLINEYLLSGCEYCEQKVILNGTDIVFKFNDDKLTSSYDSKNKSLWTPEKGWELQ